MPRAKTHPRQALVLLDICNFHMTKIGYMARRPSERAEKAAHMSISKLAYFSGCGCLMGMNIRTTLKECIVPLVVRWPAISCYILIPQPRSRCTLAEDGKDANGVDDH